jgi:ubiquinone/menaquinone biosynthesis C-methylase UbiE
MSHYIHGSDTEEQARLTKLNDLINDRCMALLDIQPGYNILDIGSGLGQFTLEMAAKAGRASRCIGIERDENQLKIAHDNKQVRQQSWVEFRQGNAESLVLGQEEWGTFNLVHARFILEHVPHPEKVVEGMAKAACRGGKIVLADDDHALMCLHPSPPGFYVLWTAYVRSYDRLGNDPFVGRRLVSLLHQSGLVNIRNNVVFFGDNAGSSTFSAYVRNLIGILLGARALILAQSLLDEKSFDESIHHLTEWARRNDAALWYIINWAEGTKA